jgi:hypothetical protein
MHDDPSARILAAIERLASDVQAQGAELNARSAEPKAQRTELKAQRAGLTGRRSDVISLRIDVMGRIDRLQDAFNARREADVVNFGTAERAERIALGTRDEGRRLCEQMNAMVRQIQRLQTDAHQLKVGA